MENIQKFILKEMADSRNELKNMCIENQLAVNAVLQQQRKYFGKLQRDIKAINTARKSGKLFPNLPLINTTDFRLFEKELEDKKRRRQFVSFRHLIQH